MRPTATCELFVDGVRVPDTGAELVAGIPAVLSALDLTWGRSGANVQPDPATCSFTVADTTAGDFLETLHVGSEVDVWAEATLPDTGGGTGYTQTMRDGTLDTYPPGDIEVNRYGYMAGYATGYVVPYAGRGQVEQVNAQVADDSYYVAYFPPAPYSPLNELPDAWDDIPKYQLGGGSWELAADVLAPAGLKFNVGLVYYDSPYHTYQHTIQNAIRYTSDGEWRRVTFRTTEQPGMADQWIGVYVGLGHGQTLHMLRWSQQPGIWADQTTTWETHQPIAIDNVFIGRPASGPVTRRALVFSGSVTDIKASPDGAGGVGIETTAADMAADLGHRVIGDTPWPQQTLATRADRIAQLGGITTAPRVRIDEPLGALSVSYHDVDAQPTLELLQDLAQTGGGTLWAATHAVTGQYLWIENPAARSSLREFTLTGGVIVIAGAIGDTTLVSACDLLEDGAEWIQDSGDVVTVVAVTWLEQTINDDGIPEPTERTVTVSDPAAIATYGTRRLSTSTQLTSAVEADQLAARLLGQARAVAWRLDGLALDTAAMPDDVDSIPDTNRQITLLELLDGTTRMGLPLTLVDMPTYAPRGAISSAYVEGGRYQYGDGYWRLALATSPSATQGESAAWGELDAAWTWSQWSATIQWVDTFGVAA